MTHAVTLPHRMRAAPCEEQLALAKEHAVRFIETMAVRRDIHEPEGLAWAGCLPSQSRI